MGIGRGDDLRLHEVNVACLFWTFFTIFTEPKGGKYRIHISNKDASEVFTMFGTDLTLQFSCTTFAAKHLVPARREGISNLCSLLSY